MAQIVEALSLLESDFRDLLGAERERADEAEAELARVCLELESSRADVDRMATALRAYISETGEAQRSLLSVARRLLGADGAESDPRSDGSEPVDTSFLSEGDEPTDEHRLIDLKNRLDMDRLDTVSRLTPGQVLARRRSG